jgi:general secretion pathway protein N
MKTRNLVATVVAMYALGVFALAPATLMDAGLQRISDGKLHLVEAKGRLWSGSGQVELRDAAGRTGVARPLAWRLRPASLLRGQLACEIQLEQDGKAFPVTVSASGIEIANADISLPAAVLGLGVPRLAALGLTGDMSLHIPRLLLGHGQAWGTLELRLREAGSIFTPILPLGNYEFKLEANGPGVQVLLQTLKGPLQLDGKGSWTIGNNPDFLAIAQVAPPHLEQLGPLLRLIAVERGAGRFELQFRQ